MRPAFKTIIIILPAPLAHLKQTADEKRSNSFERHRNFGFENNLVHDTRR